MFDQQMIETEKAEVNILDVDSDTLKLLLEFIYTGKVSNLIHFIAVKTKNFLTHNRWQRKASQPSFFMLQTSMNWTNW